MRREPKNPEVAAIATSQAPGILRESIQPLQPDESHKRRSTFLDAGCHQYPGTDAEGNPAPQASARTSICDNFLVRGPNCEEDECRQVLFDEINDVLESVARRYEAHWWIIVEDGFRSCQTL